MPLTLNDAKLKDYEVMDILIKSLSGEKPLEESVKELSIGLFPHYNLEGKALIRKVRPQLNKFIKAISGVHVTDLYFEENTLIWELQFSKLDTFKNHHSDICQFSQRLADQYQCSIDIRYYLWEAICPQDPSLLEKSSEHNISMSNFAVVLED